MGTLASAASLSVPRSRLGVALASRYSSPPIHLPFWLPGSLLKWWAPCSPPSLGSALMLFQSSWRGQWLGVKVSLVHCSPAVTRDECLKDHFFFVPSLCSLASGGKCHRGGSLVEIIIPSPWILLCHFLVYSAFSHVSNINLTTEYEVNNTILI